MTNFFPPVLILGILGAGCGVRVDTFPQPPRPKIASHDDNAIVSEGIPAILRGTVGDPDDKPETLVAWWTLDDAIVCDETTPPADGRLFCEMRIPVGPHRVALHVEDEDGGIGVAEITLWGIPTSAPDARVLEPRPDTVYYEDRLIPFVGVVTDLEDRAEDLEVWWEVDGVRQDEVEAVPDSTGRVSGVGLIPAGDDHVVELVAIDSSAKEGRAFVAPIQVQTTNSPPTCRITSPQTGSHTAIGQVATFTGTVADPNIPASDLFVAWRSDLDQLLATPTPTDDGEVTFAGDVLSLGTHQITLEVEDDLGALCSDTILFTVGAPPTATFVAPAPGSQYSVGDVVELVAEVGDVEEPPTSLSVEWTSTRQGSLGSSQPSPTGIVTLTSNALFPGDHQITLIVTDDLGLTASDTVDLSINVPPTAPVIVIEPTEPRTTDDLTASIAVASQDTDPITYTWSWYLDGVLQTALTGPSVPAAETASGQTWRVEVTPDDGRDTGPSGSATVTIDNTPPVVHAVELDGGDLVETSTLVCRVTSASDEDGDTVAFAYGWRVNGIPVPPTTDTLDGAWFNKDDRIQCVVTPSDAQESGVPVLSNEVVIRNTPPSVSGVTITPDDAQVFDVLTCTWAFSDADQDPDLSTVAWTVDGVSAGTGPTLAGAFDQGSEVVCTVTPNDGDVTAPPTDAAITIAISTPSVTDVRIVPVGATRADPVTCAYTFLDPQGDSDQSTIVWRVRGDIAGEGPTLPALSYAKGDEVACTVTPNDGRFLGTPVTATTTIANSPPTAPRVEISPREPVAGAEDILCELLIGFESSDDDGDDLTYRFTWERDGQPYRGASDGPTWSVVPAADVGELEDWTCIGQADDGTDLSPAATDTVTTTEGVEPALACATRHACAINPAGQTICWGSPGPAANPPPLVTSLAATLFNTCGLVPSGEIACWGVEGTSIMEPNVPDGVFALVRANTSAACALDSAGEPACWGSPTPPTPGVRWRDLAVGSSGRHGCGIDTSGGMRCFGPDTAGETVVPATHVNDTWIDVGVGNQFSCGLTEQGEIVCWGIDDDRTDPPPGAVFDEIATGGSHGCALSNGAVTCWGSNSRGQAPATFPAEVEALQGEFILLEAGPNYTCAMSGSGDIECWGDDRFEQSSPP